MVLPAPVAKPVGSRRILLTGFEPFGGEAVNPSWLAAQALHGRQIAGHRIVAAQLPTAFGTSVEALRALLARHAPALVVCTGQAGGRAALSLERVAINIDDARIPDNRQARPVDVPVRAGGPAAYFSTLPIKAMMLAVQAQGVPAEVSQTAGTFVCNHVFYGLMDALATDPSLRGVRGGFIHVPWLPAQGTPSLPLDDLVRGLEAALRSALSTQADAAVSGGAEH